MANGSGLTACIITFNEADRIEACLRSVDFCDEMLADFAIFERLQNIAFTHEEYKARAVHYPDHALYAEFIEIIRDPVFRAKRVWHDFDYPGVENMSAAEARERLTAITQQYCGTKSDVGFKAYDAILQTYFIDFNVEDEEQKDCALGALLQVADGFGESACGKAPEAKAMAIRAMATRLLENEPKEPADLAFGLASQLSNAEGARPVKSQLVALSLRCRHTTGLNWTAIGIEHVGFSDQAILGDPAQIAASLQLTRWLRCRYAIAIKNVIGHNESLSSPYHHDRVPAFQHQTHSDWNHADMVRYRSLLARLPCR